MADAGEAIFGNIILGARGNAGQGSFKYNKSGLVWRKNGGGRVVEITGEDIKGMIWSPIQRGYMLGVERNEGPTLTFMGFRDADLETLKSVGLVDIREEAVAISGHNWGSIELDGASLVFKVGNKPAFVVPLPDVSQAQQGRDDVMLQFPIDDTTAGDREDQLVEMAFHVPKDCPDFAPSSGADGEVPPPASKLFLDLINEYTDAATSTGDAVFTFDSVAVVVPRGRFDIELYSHSLKLVGQAQDYRVQYSSILRIFVLPKAATPQTLVAIALDPPIRKGQTYYNTILCQFHNDEEMTAELELSDEALAGRNEKGAKLDKTMTGMTPDVFARVLRGLSGSKLTRPGAFRDASGEGHAVRCSYKADDGYLYPLERAFFYVQKPPLLMTYDDVDSVEFLRPAAGVTASKTFDLSIRMKSGTDNVFRGIPRSEWTNLFEWIQAKNLRIENFKEAQRGPGAALVSYQDDMVPIDAGLAGLAAGASSGEDSDDAEDEDFAAANESSSSEEESSDEEGQGEGGAERPKKKSKGEKKEGGSSEKAKKVAAAPKEKPAAKEDTEPAGKTRKPRKKKDKNAPKKAMSAFMLFSNAMRDKVKQDNPGIAFTDVAKKLGELWKAMGPEDKVPYDQQAAAAKEKYAEDMKAYNAKKAAEAGGAKPTDDDDDDAADEEEEAGGDAEMADAE